MFVLNEEAQRKISGGCYQQDFEVKCHELWHERDNNEAMLRYFPEEWKNFYLTWQSINRRYIGWGIRIEYS